MTTVPHGIPLASYIEHASSMPLDQFVATYGSGFFIVVTSKPEPPRTLQRTDKVTTSDEPTGDNRIFVLPLLRKEKTTAANRTQLLRVGRGDSCDIVIGDVSISKLHAFVQPEKDERFSVLDAGSRNGTFIGETAVAARGTGEPTLLTPLDKLRMGAVSMSFVDAPALMKLLKMRRYL